MLLSVSHDESLPADPTFQKCSADSLVPAQTTHKQILPCSLVYGKEELHTLSFKNSVSLMTLFLKIFVLPSSNLIFLSKYHETKKFFHIAPDI
jgi:hypothetical protein